MAKPMTRHNAQVLTISFTLNGRPQELDVEPHELLLDVVRDRLGLTGAKRSCDVQVCGACTLLVDGRPVSTCTTLAFEVHGRSVLTIEGCDEGNTNIHNANDTPDRINHDLALEILRMNVAFVADRLGV